MSRNEKNKKCFIVLVLRSELLRRAAMAIVLVCFAFAGAAQAGTSWGEPVPLVTERQKLLASEGAVDDCTSSAQMRQ